MSKKNNSYWYKDAIIYEVHIKSFYDSNNDGLGDIKGLTQKLKYLRNLGVTAIWILPFFPSPQKDDGYDIADYVTVNPAYGNLKDFKELLQQAHKYNIKIIIELVINHTSIEHKWFKQARTANKNSALRDRYVWSDNPDKYADARIIFSDFETSNWTWDPIAKAYYWHRFYSHQPDLNFDNKVVQKEIINILDFWLKLGVDGLRLDAIPYLFERENTNCENLPETHDFLKKLRSYVDKNYSDKMLLAEANQWPEDAAAYFGNGDEAHMAFHFPLMPRMFMAVEMEDSYPITEILRITPQISSNCQWAIFLRNHDELTLEMVTDEERDYMYRMYVKNPKAKINLGIRRRLSPLMENDRKKVELMNNLLFTLPGTPVIYYGDEIGMGDNFFLGDRDGVRTPMQWSPDRNAGFSKANPQQLYLPVIIDPEYHYEALNVENQERNTSSLLWFMKRLISARKKFKSLSQGSLDIIDNNNPKLLSFIRKLDEEIVLMVVNLSKYSQSVELDLHNYLNYQPEEVFSFSKFPLIKSRDYMLTIGPYDAYWLQLKEKSLVSIEEKHRVLQVSGSCDKIFEPPVKDSLEEDILPYYVTQCRWFASKAKALKRITIVENALFKIKNQDYYLTIIETTFTGTPSEKYFLPLTCASTYKSLKIIDSFPKAKICSVLIGKEEHVLIDAIFDNLFLSHIFDALVNKKKIKGHSGYFSCIPAKILKEEPNLATVNDPKPLKAEQSNTSAVFSNKYFLKFYRKIDKGENPELEIIKKLSKDTTFKNIPSFAGFIDYKRPNKPEKTIALMQGFVENERDTWKLTCEYLEKYFENLLSYKRGFEQLASLKHTAHISDRNQIPEKLAGFIGEFFLDFVELLAKRTAELHLALSSIKGDAYQPEPFSLLYQKARFQGLESQLHRTFKQLEEQLANLPDELVKDAGTILKDKKYILSVMRKIVTRKLSAKNIRIHGDFHLGQVLFTGKDFIIIDFEGEPARSLSLRKLKKCPLKDVAGLIRSFHYAALSTLFTSTLYNKHDIKLLESWIEPWFECVSAIFLNTYLASIKPSGLVPSNREEIKILMDTFLFEKAIYELAYELNNRPDWLKIPLKGLNHLIKAAKTDESI
ncbi:maltose alpha-D-glucosyltransferase [Thermoproteota archaeon]